MIGKTCNVTHRWHRSSLFRIDLSESKGRIANAVSVAFSGLLLRVIPKSDDLTGRKQPNAVLL